MDEQTQKKPLFTLEDIGGEFGALLGQLFAHKISQANEIANLKADNAALSAEIDRLNNELHQVQLELVAENENLRSELHQAQTDLLAAQGKDIIDAAAIKELNS